MGDGSQLFHPRALRGAERPLNLQTMVHPPLLAQTDAIKLRNTSVLLRRPLLYNTNQLKPQ